MSRIKDALAHFWLRMEPKLIFVVIVSVVLIVWVRIDCLEFTEKQRNDVTNLCIIASNLVIMKWARMMGTRIQRPPREEELQKTDSRDTLVQEDK